MGPYRPTLDAIARKGHLARVILPASINAEDKRDVAFLRAHGVQVRLMPVKPIYMHAKAVISSNEAFVGSENFTQTSLEVNRETGLLLNGRPVSELQAQFNRDWARAEHG
jgi:phosphatidylserine/phosphatidylglycerophosphate/cardiolipin synthase-like enzyme